MKLSKFKKSIIASISSFSLLFSAFTLPLANASETKGINANAQVDGFNYNVELEVFINEDGSVREVKDAGTNPGISNRSFWEMYLQGKGLDKFVGKTLNDIDNIDAVTNATITSNAAKKAVKNALTSSVSNNNIESNTKDKYPVVEPGIKKGEAPIPGESSSSRKIKVTVEVGENGRILGVKDDGSSLPFSIKRNFKDYFNKFKGENYFIGKSLKDVAEMDVYSGYGAHVPGSRGETSPYVSSAWGVRNAVLNALGYDYTVSEKNTDHIVNVESNIPRYHYDQKSTVRISADGKVVMVSDNNTKEFENYKTSDNLQRIQLYDKSNGYAKFVGKNLSEVKAMDVSKYGIDGVSGATYNATAVKQNVIKAFEKAGFNTDVSAIPIEGRIFEGESETIPNNHGNKIKIRAYIDDENRVVKIEDNGSNPGELPWSTTNHEDSPWDKFTKYRGFAKFHGKNLQEISTMNMESVDSIDVAGRQNEISKAAREAVLSALNKAINTPKIDKSLLENTISNAKDFLSNMEVGDIPGQYPREALTYLQQEINLAESVLGKSSVTQEEVNSANYKLLEALKSTKESVVPVADKTSLLNSIQEAVDFISNITEGYDQGEYPFGTIEKLNTLISTGKGLSENNLAKEVEINNMIASIAKAIDMAKASINPELEIRSIVNEETGITLTSLMSQLTTLQVSILNEGESQALENSLKNDSRIKTVLGRYDISVINGITKGIISIKFNLENNKDIKKLVVKHVNKNLEIESFDVLVKDGVAMINVNSLSPFAVAELNSENNASLDINNDVDNNSNSVSAEDNHNNDTINNQRGSDVKEKNIISSSKKNDDSKKASVKSTITHNTPDTSDNSFITIILTLTFISVITISFTKKRIR